MGVPVMPIKPKRSRVGTIVPHLYFNVKDNFVNVEVPQAVSYGGVEFPFDGILEQNGNQFYQYRFPTVAPSNLKRLLGLGSKLNIE